MSDGAELILSKSSIERWLSCRYAWLLTYAHRLPGRPNLDMIVGTAVHAGVEAYWKGKDPRSGLEKAWAREVRSMGSAFVVGDFADHRLDAHKMLGVYLASIAPTFTPSIVERDFLVRINGVLVSGRIDAADDDDVHDTKTTSTPSKVTADQHRLGMTLYRHGYASITGRLPKRLLLDVVARNGRWKQLPVEPDDAGMAEVVAHVAAGINAGDFEPTGAAVGECPRCPFLMVCRFGEPWRLTPAVESGESELVVGPVLEGATP